MMKATTPIRVLVVDDHPILRTGVAAIIDSQTDMEVVGQAGTAREALELHTKTRPDVTLMDLKLPGMSGLEAIRLLRQRRNDVKVLVLTAHDGDENMYQSLLAGASGYIIKGMPQNVLLQGIRQVHQGNEFLPPEISRALARRSVKDELSARERQVLTLIASGQSNREIAQQLGITEGTVKCHVGVILSSLGVKDRTHAVLVALRRGFVHL